MADLSADAHASSARRILAVARRIFSGRSENRAGPSGSAAGHVKGPQRTTPASHFALQQIRVPNKLRRVGGGRPAVNFARRRHLLQFSRAQQRDPVRHHHRLFLIVGHEDERNADLALQRFQFHLHLSPQIRVQRGKRLIQQQQSRTVHQRPRQRDPLLLSSADFRGLRLRVRRHLYFFQRFRYARCNLRFGSSSPRAVRKLRSVPQ